MRKIPRGQSWKKSAPAQPVGLLAAAAALALAALAGGCSSVRTPLPSLAPTASTGMSHQQQEAAVNELNRVRDTHEQDAARSIEESR